MNASAKASKPISEIERQILSPKNIDDLGEAVLSLAREVWVLTDRQLVLEQVLAGEGIDIREKVDRYKPDTAFAADLAARRKRLIGELLRTLKTGIPEGVTGSNKFGG
jgi:hypothetical protein